MARPIMSYPAKLAAVGVLVLAAGCSSLNPFASKPSPKTLPSPLPEFQSAISVRPKWQVSVGKAGNYAFTPALARDSVFAAGADGNVARIDAASGQVIWSVNAGSKLTAGVGTDGITVAVAGEKGAVIALDENGRQRWKMQTSSEVLSAPAVGQGLVVVRSLDNQITAYDAENGSRRWSVRRTLPSLVLRSAPGLVIANGSIIAAMPGGKLLALDAATGASRWEVAVGEPRGATELERIVDISGQPYLAGRDVCAVSFQGRVGCFDIVTGTARWTRDFSSNVSVGADERFVFAVDERSKLTAFSRLTGQNAWQNDKLLNRRLSAPASFGRSVATGDLQGFIHFFSREDGSLIGRVGTDGSAIQSVPLLAGSNLIFQTQAGTVVALATE